MNKNSQSSLPTSSHQKVIIDKFINYRYTDYKDIVKPSVSDNVKQLYGMPARTNLSGMRQTKLAPGFSGKTTDAE